jgi:hypothetical protein
MRAGAWKAASDVVVAWVLLALTALGLKLGSLRRWVALIRASTRTVRRTVSPALIGRRRLAVGRAAVLLPCITTCLSRSVALWWLLRRDGISCDVHLGVRPT